MAAARTPERDIDNIIREVRQQMPEVTVTQLQVKWPGDDNGIWWFSLPIGKKDIQLESSFGVCPFLVETDEESGTQARKAMTVNEAVSMIINYLASLAQPFTPDDY